MILPYPVRLLCLCLASFFLIHLVLGAIVTLLVPAAARSAERFRPALGCRFLLLLRFAPTVCAAFVVAAVCVPSYLWHEPVQEAEEISIASVVAAVLGLSIWSISIVRASRVLVRSRNYVRKCRSSSHITRVPGHSSPVWLVEDAPRLLALTGIIHPRIFISRRVLQVLSASQLAAALDHEDAHRASQDNLKRLSMMISPGLLPFYRGYGCLEREWARLAEWAADDTAVRGDSQSSLSLALALVRIARLGAVEPPTSLMTAFLDNAGELSARVNRLLAAPPARAPICLSPACVAGGLTVVTVLVAVLLQPAALSSAHGFFEYLMH